MSGVTVKLEDLEALVFSTGAIKAIEQALLLRKNDPFVKPYLDLTEAHNRLASAIRNARRSEAGTAVNWDDPLNENERKFLMDLTIGEWVSPTFRLEHPEIDSLMAKGCLVMGQFVEGILWSDRTKPELKVSAKGFPLKVTARGQEKLLAKG